MAAVETWPIPSAPTGRRVGVSGLLGPVRPPWGSGRSAGSCLADVGA